MTEASLERLDAAITTLVTAHRRALIAHHRMMHSAGGLIAASPFLLVVAVWDRSWPHAAVAVLLVSVAILLIRSAASPKQRAQELEQFVERLGKR